MDSYRITNTVLGTTVEIGTWIRAGEPPDFDDLKVYQAIYAQNALVDGAELAFMRNDMRTFHFPLRLASGPMSLDLAEMVLSKLITAPQGKAYIELRPETVPSSNQVRFDILNGRMQMKYSIYHQRAARREIDLFLDVSPWGYQPTYMLLASTAATSPFLFLQWNPASIMGDGPPNWELNFVATTQPSAYTQSWGQEGLIYSLGRNPSVLASPLPFIPAGSVALATGYLGMSSLIGTVASDGYAPQGGQFLRVGIPSFYWGTWMQAAQYPNTISWSAPGRYRIYAFARMSASSMPIQIAADISNTAIAGVQPLASGYPIATLLPQGNVPNAPSSFAPSGGYQILDLGEFAVPITGSNIASAAQQAVFTVRLWSYLGTTTPGLATIPNIELAGIYGLPVDGDYGVLAGGLNQPTYTNLAAGLLFMGGVQIKSDARTVTGAQAQLNFAPSLYEQMTPAVDLRSLYYGNFPAGATNGVLEAFMFSRFTTNAAATHSIGHANKYTLGASIRYQPRFAYVRAM